MQMVHCSALRVCKLPCLLSRNSLLVHHLSALLKSSRYMTALSANKQQCAMHKYMVSSSLVQMASISTELFAPLAISTALSAQGRPTLIARPALPSQSSPSSALSSTALPATPSPAWHSTQTASASSSVGMECASPPLSSAMTATLSTKMAAPQPANSSLASSAREAAPPLPTPVFPSRSSPSSPSPPLTRSSSQ